jgi:hypothetical protein
MLRFFFDYKSQDQSLYDYKGCEFLTTRAAIEFAEVIAEDLRNSLAAEWKSWSVEVRNAEGEKLIALPVGSTGPIAA